MKRCNSHVKTIVFASLAAFAAAMPVFISCKQGSGQQTKNEQEQPQLQTVTVTLIGDEGTIITAGKFDVNKGALWKTVRTEAKKRVMYKEKYVEKAWKYRSASAEMELNDSHAFEESQTVLALSQFIGGITPPPAQQGFVKVPVPENAVIGQNSDKDMPGPEIYWYGVFRTGRKIKLSPYAIGTHEVTYKLWKEVYDWAVNHNYTFANSGQKGGASEGNYIEAEHHEEEPVTMVSWRDAIVWCNAYTEKQNNGDTSECVYTYSGQVLKDAVSFEGENKTGNFHADKAECNLTKKGFRLPTDTEWEFAARYQGTNGINAQQFGNIYLTHINSGSGALKPLGFFGIEENGIAWAERRDELNRVAVYKQWWNGSGDDDMTPPVTGTAKTGSREPNALGLYDMSGNVWEWCWDWYDDDPSANDGAYTVSGIIVNPKGAAGGLNRTGRGGSWFNSMQMQSVGQRSKWAPSFAKNNRGFRLAKTAAE